MFTPLKKLLNQSARSKGFAKRIEGVFVIEACLKALEKSLGDNATQAKPLFFKDETVTIACLSSAMAQEIKLRKYDIIDHINDVIGEKVVRDLRFRL